LTRPVPRLSLSHGQVLWCLAGGNEPLPLLRDQVRYLRQRGIPFMESEQGKGRGVRISYNFYQFIEVGVAYNLLRQRIEPRLLENLIEERTLYRNAYRQAYLELEPALFEDDPRLLSMLQNELTISLYDRYSKSPGKIEMSLDPSNLGEHPFGGLFELHSDGSRTAVIALKSLVLSLIKLARIAPMTRPGPRT
jgi:hypothetical protein